MVGVSSPRLLAKLNPFRGVERPGQVWAWGMYDLANQSFTLLIVTLFFGVYFKTRVVGDDGRGEALWGQAFALASAIAVLASPFVGAAADVRGRRRAWLIGAGAGCVALTALLSLVGPGDIGLGMGLFIAACALFMLGENFLGSFLPQISTPKNVGRVSAIGWTFGYVGALACLPVALLIPGVSEGTDDGFRRVFLFAAAWFALAGLPTALFLREERVVASERPAGSSALHALRRLGRTARELPRFRDLAVFLSAFFIYSCGVQVIVVFAGIIAERHLGSGGRIVWFVWALAAVCGAASFATALLHDRAGRRTALVVALVVWILTALGASLLPERDGPGWAMWLLGLGVGVGLGVVGPASRALVADLTPASRSGEFFGFWGLAYKSAGVAGPLTYGLVSERSGSSTAMLVVAGAFALGLGGLALVDVEAGRRAAEDERPTRADRTVPS